MRVVPWVLVAILAVAFTVQWRLTEEARAQVAGIQASAAEVSSLYAEQSQQYARWLRTGLEELRAGDTPAGLRTLDTLLASTARSLERGSGEHVATEAYFGRVGDPWER